MLKPLLFAIDEFIEFYCIVVDVVAFFANVKVSIFALFAVSKIDGNVQHFFLLIPVRTRYDVRVLRFRSLIDCQFSTMHVKVEET